ncbi:MAG: hypothetical protein OXM61_03085 [Candidatus Poribacteria bacterium]|nr:hypothetical protein [Candidatus Poribacteria bacterium]
MTCLLQLYCPTVGVLCKRAVFSLVGPNQRYESCSMPKAHAANGIQRVERSETRPTTHSLFAYISVLALSYTSD